MFQSKTRLKISRLKDVRLHIKGTRNNVESPRHINKSEKQQKATYNLRNFIGPMVHDCTDS